MKLKTPNTFCKHNQNRIKTNFLINLEKIGLIFSLSWGLSFLIVLLLVFYLFGYNKSKFSLNFQNQFEYWFVGIIGFLMAVIALLMIKNAYQIKLIKNHEPTEQNCQKIDENIQQGVKPFKKNYKKTIYFSIFIIIPIAIATRFIFFDNVSSLQIAYILFVYLPFELLGYCIIRYGIRRNSIIIIIAGIVCTRAIWAIDIWLFKYDSIELKVPKKPIKIIKNAP